MEGLNWNGLKVLPISISLIDRCGDSCGNHCTLIGSWSDLLTAWMIIEWVEYLKRGNEVTEFWIMAKYLARVFDKHYDRFHSKLVGCCLPTLCFPRFWPITWLMGAELHRWIKSSVWRYAFYSLFCFTLERTFFCIIRPRFRAVSRKLFNFRHTQQSTFFLWHKVTQIKIC